MSERIDGRRASAPSSPPPAFSPTELRQQVASALSSQSRCSSMVFHPNHSAITLYALGSLSDNDVRQIGNEQGRSRGQGALAVDKAVAELRAMVKSKLLDIATQEVAQRYQQLHALLANLTRSGSPTAYLDALAPPQRLAALRSLGFSDVASQRVAAAPLQHGREIAGQMAIARRVLNELPRESQLARSNDLALQLFTSRFAPLLIPSYADAREGSFLRRCVAELAAQGKDARTLTDGAVAALGFLATTRLAGPACSAVARVAATLERQSVAVAVGNGAAGPDVLHAAERAESTSTRSLIANSLGAGIKRLDPAHPAGRIAALINLAADLKNAKAP